MLVLAPSTATHLALFLRIFTLITAPNSGGYFSGPLLNQAVSTTFNQVDLTTYSPADSIMFNLVDLITYSLVDLIMLKELEMELVKS